MDLKTLVYFFVFLIFRVYKLNKKIIKMETSVLIPQDFSLAMSPTSPGSPEQIITVWSTNEIPQGSLFYPFQGTIRIDNLDTFKYLEDEDVSIYFCSYFWCYIFSDS